MSVQSSTRPSPQESHLVRARASLKQTLANYSRYVRSLPHSLVPTAVQPELDRLAANLHKLEQTIVRIAVFGLVSRGKSAILNALVGEALLETGPINGITQQPRVIHWSPTGGLVPTERAIVPQSSSKVQIELIDTPGLDEIAGQARAEMARQVAEQADLILFVISGDMTRTEYTALCDLRQAQKPLILVFNKIDLYPDQSRQAIYANLQQLAARLGGKQLQQLLTADEIVMVAAAPAPVQLRVEYPDGRVAYEWETLPPQIDELQAKILTILHREGRSLLALNALTQARSAETHMATAIVTLRSAEAEALIWQFTRYKAAAIALNPIAIIDIIGGVASDLAMIRALAKLYGLPITNYEASKLLKTLLMSSGTLLLGELGSSIMLGLGKSAAALTDPAAGLSAYVGVATVQAGLAGYGSYAIGRAAQTYLEQGCTWGSQGASTVIQDILRQVEPNTIIYRLRQELLN